MTRKLLSHQVNGLKEIRYHRRQQLYAGGYVHDMEAAISYLRKNMLGFFVVAPLDWGHGTPVRDDPTKATAIAVDIASGAPNRQTEDTKI